jgi:hypothetical protein
LSERAAIENQGWEIGFFKSTLPKDEGLAVESTNEFLQYLSKLTDPHVMLFHTNREPNRKNLAENIRQYFRLRHLDPTLLAPIKRQEFNVFWSTVSELLIEEKLWAQTVKPNALSSPLMLPETVFSCKSQSQMWNIAASCITETSIRGARILLDQFSAAHLWKRPDAGKVWKDSKDLVFDPGNEKHGIAETPRDWKFSFHIPPGAHFDVTHAKSDAFVLRTRNGMYSVLQKKHQNVDPHGNSW